MPVEQIVASAHYLYWTNNYMGLEVLCKFQSLGWMRPSLYFRMCTRWGSQLLVKQGQFRYPGNVLWQRDPSSLKL